MNKNAKIIEELQNLINYRRGNSYYYCESEYDSGHHDGYDSGKESVLDDIQAIIDKYEKE